MERRGRRRVRRRARPPWMPSRSGAPRARRRPPGRRRTETRLFRRVSGEFGVGTSVDATGDGRFGFCERLVKELRVNSPEGSTGRAGRGGRVGVRDGRMDPGGSESRVGACEMTMRVWGPRGLEASRASPCPRGCSSRATTDDDGFSLTHS